MKCHQCLETTTIIGILLTWSFYFETHCFYFEHTCVSTSAPEPSESSLSSRLKILWLTLCQPHNGVEIEVTAFLTSISNMSNSTAAIIQNISCCNCFLLLLVSARLHPVPGGEGRPCTVCQQRQEDHGQVSEDHSFKTTHTHTH